jgi:hypothetical protein
MSVRLVVLVFAGLFVSALGFQGLFTQKVDYSNDVKPILNKHCIGCHGGVKKAGDVSFLFEHEMYSPGKSGNLPVVKGDWKKSEMMKRILTDDPDEKMPKDGAPLSETEIEVLKNWIDQGAEWGVHWAYQQVKKPEIPSVNTWKNLFGLIGNHVSWQKNSIDHFILDKLKKEGLTPNSDAERAILARRVSLDLTGLPPAEEAVAAFLKDSTAQAYERFVDQLLDSPSFGERWASMWLDLARYADTKGYEKDTYRNIWRFRDYVIRSFNEDKPFDQFTLEQLAGDLLTDADEFPDETTLIATGFHRNTMTNDEGGTQDEEFRVAAVMDRVNSTWEVWHGTTFACVQCHSHTYDPITHEEYYKYMAYFNNTRDEDVVTETPGLRHYRQGDSVIVEQLKQWVASYNPQQSKEVYQFLKVMEPKINSHDFILGDNTSLLDSKFFAIKDKGNASLPELDFSNKNQLLLAIGTNSKKARIDLYADSTRTVKVGSLQVPFTKSAWRDSTIALQLPELDGKKALYLELDNPSSPDDWVMIKWIALQTELPAKGTEAHLRNKQLYLTLIGKKVEETPVFWEGTRELARKTHLFERGNWLVKGAEVTPEVPSLFADMPTTFEKNRLGLAKWMVHRDHPLTSRVLVNRVWEQLFGRGIVETLEDFGSQGAPPTHPELLDWLAATLMEDYQWHLKPLIKTMVMSATYRQSSEISETKKTRDPFNYWLSYGPRVRLSAEQVRDQALAVSGLLSAKQFGKSVMPPQPEGIWLSPYNGESWTPSEGEGRYRRAVYTFWKRTAPYPSMTTFDAPSREFCQSRRLRTNTPLQALVTMNDPVYLESAEKIAEKMDAFPGTVEEKLARGYYLLTYKPITPEKLDALRGIYEDAIADFQTKEDAVDKFLSYTSKKEKSLAALAVSANVLLNLDEVITKE